MKIAVITEDGKTISQHFGRAPFYMVLSIEEGKITNREIRNKLGHGQFAGEHGEHSEHHEGHHDAGHGLDEASHNKHAQMANSISDCQVLICGGMGMGAYVSMQQLNIRPIVTDLQDIEAVVEIYINGNLIDHAEKLH